MGRGTMRSMVEGPCWLGKPPHRTRCGPPPHRCATERTGSRPLRGAAEAVDAAVADRAAEAAPALDRAFDRVIALALPDSGNVGHAAVEARFRLARAAVDGGVLLLPVAVADRRGDRRDSADQHRSG